MQNKVGISLLDCTRTKHANVDGNKVKDKFLFAQDAAMLLKGNDSKLNKLNEWW